MKVFGIIPARYASTRFPGKPLVQLDGHSMVEWVYHRTSKAFDMVAVATDDERIAAEVRRFGGRVVITSPDHRSGTDRCAEALLRMQVEDGTKADVVVNVQGDEPFIDPALLSRLAACFNDSSTQIATVVKPFENTVDMLNPNNVKVVMSATGRAVYFSRSPIPYIRGFAREEWLGQHTFHWHLGLYAYRAAVLDRLTQLAPSPLEIAESLEQNRWLENDYCIRVIQTQGENIAIDTPEDLVYAQSRLAEKQIRF
ncbi:MAG: 3-deoxy-manno-octulosonate cytidylyltransferase [Bacteroidales bacterium]|nr:3-deoxy-manno-octulosonate cytidylyltransferase [Bacteroidales bacterium]